MSQEHVVIQCPLTPDCFVRVSVWGQPTQEGIELLMQILTLQLQGGCFPAKETQEQRKLALLPKRLHEENAVESTAS